LHRRYTVPIVAGWLVIVPSNYPNPLRGPVQLVHGAPDSSELTPTETTTLTCGYFQTTDVWTWVKSTSKPLRTSRWTSKHDDYLLPSSSSYLPESWRMVG
jgi:hypothetical protein